MKEHSEACKDSPLRECNPDCPARNNPVPLQPEQKDDFMECDTCRVKPGSPMLCTGCLHNRNVMSKLKEQKEAMIENVEWMKETWPRDKTVKETIEEVLALLKS